MILKKIKKRNSGYNDYDVIFEDKIVGEADDDLNTFYITLKYSKLKLLQNHSIKELFTDKSNSFSIPLQLEKLENLDWVNINKSYIWISNDNTFSIFILPKFLKWDKNISIDNFIDECINHFLELNIEVAREKSFLEDGVYFNGKINIENDIYSEYISIIKIFNDEVGKILTKNLLINNSYLLSTYAFPPEIKAVCEQYLIYFSKFLEDLGVEALTNIESDSNKTRFTVKPINSNEALSNIKEMLDIYLKIPTIQNIDSFSNNFNDISVQQLVANVYHLKSQLILANSTLQNKESTIENLKLINYQNSKIINSQTNEEKILGGIIVLDKLEIKGVKVNLAEIFRKLKRKLK